MEPYAVKILGSPIEDSIKDLSELAMCREDMVLEILELIRSGKARSVAEARNTILAKDAPEPTNFSAAPDVQTASPIETQSEPAFQSNEAAGQMSKDAPEPTNFSAAPDVQTASPIETQSERAFQSNEAAGQTIESGNELPLSKGPEVLIDHSEKPEEHANSVTKDLEPKVVAAAPHPPAHKTEPNRSFDDDLEPEEGDLLPEVDSDQGINMGHDTRGNQIRYNVGNETYTITDTGEVLPLAKAIARVVTSDPYRILLFEAWKAKHGYEKNLGQFLLDCFDEYFDRRHVQLSYAELIRKKKGFPQSALIVEEG